MISTVDELIEELESWRETRGSLPVRLLDDEKLVQLARATVGIDVEGQFVVVLVPGPA